MLARRRSRTRSSLKRYIVLGALLLAAGGAVYLIWLSPVFTIQAVEVEGRELAPGVDFNEAVGENIIFYEPSFSLEDAPQTAFMEVDKRYLRRVVKFILSAKERYAIWCLQSRAECFWIDEEGRAFAPAPDVKGPLISRLMRD